MKNLHILVLDDEKEITDNLKFFLDKLGFHTSVANEPPAAFDLLKKEPFDIMLCDIMLPRMSGIEVLARVKRDYPECEVIMISGHGNMDTVIEAIRIGAVDFIRKPFTMADIQLAIERTGKFIRLQSELDEEKNRSSLISRQLEKMIDRDFIWESTAMQGVLDNALKVAGDRQVQVLITGENGTGKEVVARIIHYASERKKKPFFPINSAAIPDTLLESEFFGHKKGAFTGADDDRKGCFELADGGTLFLDEISDMPHPLQAKLLRAIEEKKIRPVGSNREVAVDIRIISATNRDIEKLIEEDKFRRDLYHRINTFEIRIPPLRERTGDIEPLLNHFIGQITRAKKLPEQKIGKDIINILLAYHFPGNVRELKNMAERAMILANGGTLSTEHFLMQGEPKKETPVKAGPDLSLEQHEVNYLREVLHAAGNNKTKASQILGIPRYTLIRKMKKYNLS